MTLDIRGSMSLSPRLQALAAMISDQYEHIWDCCCDHGFLGQALIDQYPGSVIHFVDQVMPIMDQLEKDLAAFEYPNTRWQAHCLDLNKLIIPETGSTQLVIIAGVGGDLIVDFVVNLLKNNPQQSLDFLLCPIRQIYWLRSRLGELGLGVKAEKIVVDKGIFYEQLYLTSRAGRPLSRTGDAMWNLSDSEHQAYLQQIIKHYQKVLKGRPDIATPALSDYGKLLEQHDLSVVT